MPPLRKVPIPAVKKTVPHSACSTVAHIREPVLRTSGIGAAGQRHDFRLTCEKHFALCNLAAEIGEPLCKKVAQDAWRVLRGVATQEDECARP